MDAGNPGRLVDPSAYNREDRSVSVADPLKKNPIASSRYYSVNLYRLVCAIMLGILSYDGNLLIIQAKKRKGVSLIEGPCKPR